MNRANDKTQSTPRLVPRMTVPLASLSLIWACASAAVGSDVSTSVVEGPGSTPTVRVHPLAPALKLARASYQKISEAGDYEATFAKREVVGRRVSAHTMHIKLRHKPFSVYLRFYEPNAGREVIYVDGKYKGHMLVHEPGIKSIAGIIPLLPNSPEALAESRHPITRIGIANMVKGVIDQWEAEMKYGECNVKYYPNAKLGRGPTAVECKVLETSHPVPRRQFKFHMTRLYIDKKTGFPVRVEQHGFPTRPGASPQVLEEYTYSNIKVNTGLADLDFDVRNPKYAF